MRQNCIGSREGRLETIIHHGIILFNGNDIIKEILELDELANEKLLMFATNGDYQTPTCPKCDIKMVKKKNKKDPDIVFWGCRNYPKCTQTFQFKVK